MLAKKSEQGQCDCQTCTALSKVCGGVKQCELVIAEFLIMGGDGRRLVHS